MSATLRMVMHLGGVRVMSGEDHTRDPVKATALFLRSEDPFQNTTPCHVRARSRSWRRAWKLYRHFDRQASWFARGGKYGLSEAAQDAFHSYEDMLGLPSTKGYEP